MIIINFKLYKNTFGKGALKLAKICKKVMYESKIEVVLAVSPVDIYKIKKETGLKLYCQNIDEYEDGRWTGWISANQMKKAGASGTLLNHSEHKIPPGKVKKILKNKRKGFEIVLCVRSIGQAEKWALKTKPDFIAYEPSYLIASKDRSVSSEKPEAVKRLVKMCGKIPVLVGAGVKNKKDVEIALKLGAKGVLVASDIVCADDPEKELKEMIEGFKKVC